MSLVVVLLLEFLTIMVGSSEIPSLSRSFRTYRALWSSVRAGRVFFDLEPLVHIVCEKALLSLFLGTSDFLEAAVVLLHMSMAFDSVNHDIVVNK